MKKTMLAIASLAILFAACKKDSSPSQSPLSLPEEKIPVSFSVTDFVQKIETMPKPGTRTASGQLRDSALGSKVSYITYVVYKMDGTYPTTVITQSVASQSEDFGVIRDSLAGGYYNITLIASKDSIVLDPEGSAMELLSGTLPDEIAAIEDIYAINFWKTINSNTPNVIQDVTLDRISGKLEVNILDGSILEAANKEIIVKVNPVNRRLRLNSLSVVNGPSQAFTTLNRVSSNKHETQLLDRSNCSITITVIDKTSGIVEYTKVIPNITIGKNQRTVVSGNVTNSYGNTNSNWDVLLNREWGTDILVEY